jgi:hypothetical protein
MSSDIGRVADPHHFIADPDPSFYYNADLDPAFHFNADPVLLLDPAPHQVNANLQPLFVHRPSSARI